MKQNTEIRTTPENTVAGGAAATLLIIAVMLTAATLRSPLTGVGPLIGEIQNSTGLSHTLAGMLTTLPLIAFAVFALAAPKLSSRFGIERTLLYCMILMTGGILLRSMPAVPALFGGTALVGSAIAIANVLVPSLIKRDFPLRLGLMTSLYTSSMNMWSAIASGISMPISRTGLGWRGALACWLVLSAATALIWLPLARRHSASRSNTRTAAALASGGAVKVSGLDTAATAPEGNTTSRFRLAVSYSLAGNDFYGLPVRYVLRRHFLVAGNSP